MTDRQIPEHHGPRIIAVGGHTRSIGKTAAVEDIIRATRDAAWTAVKITQFGHGVCSLDGQPCDCAPRHGRFAVEEDGSREGRTDTSRFLLAGAARSLWVRTRQGCLSDAMPRIAEKLRGSRHVIIESNSLLDFLQPDFYLVVLDPLRADFKESARRLLARADAFLLRAPLNGMRWPGVAHEHIGQRPQFPQPPGHALPAALLSLIAARVFAPPPPT